MTTQYKLIDAPVPVKTIKNAENRHLTAIEKRAIRAGMNQGVACFKSGRKIYTISHIDTNHYCVEIEERETTIFNRLETVSRKVPFSVCLEKAKDEVKEKSIEQIEAEQLELMLTQEKSIETQEVINNPVVETVKETKKEIDNPVIETKEETKEETTDTAVKTVKETNSQNKVAKLQARLTRLNAQLSITKGNRAKAKIVIEILKVESAIKQLELIQEKPVEVKEETEQSKPVDAPVTKKDEFCKKPDRKTVKLLESRFKDAQINITETQVILKSETGELAINCSMELPELDYRRRDVIKSLIRQNQNPKIHSVYEYIGSILLTA